MGKNPFHDRPEETKNPSQMRIGQRVLIVEKHKQGVKSKEELTECYINGFLTSRDGHPQGAKVAGIRASFVRGENIIWKNEKGLWEGDQDLIKQIGKVGTHTGDLDLNKYAVGRVQYLLENEMNVEIKDIVQITKTLDAASSHHYLEGVVESIIKYDFYNGHQMTMVQLDDGGIGWVKVIVKKNVVNNEKTEIDRVDFLKALFSN